MNCKEIREQMLDMLGAEPTGMAAEHLRACESCREELGSLRATMQMMDAWEAPEPSPYFDVRLQARLREVKEQEATKSGSVWAALAGWMRKPALGISALATIALVAVLYVGTPTNVQDPDGNVAVQNQNGGVTPGDVQQVSAVKDLDTLAESQDVLADFELLDEIHTSKKAQAVN